VAPLASPPPGYGGLLASPHKTKAHEFSLDPAAPFIDAPPAKSVEAWMGAVEPGAVIFALDIATTIGYDCPEENSMDAACQRFKTHNFSMNYCLFSENLPNLGTY
jgi:hypothetical protein